MVIHKTVQVQKTRKSMCEVHAEPLKKFFSRRKKLLWTRKEVSAWVFFVLPWILLMSLTAVTKTSTTSFWLVVLTSKKGISHAAAVTPPAPC